MPKYRVSVGLRVSKIIDVEADTPERARQKALIEAEGPQLISPKWRIDDSVVHGVTEIPEALYG